MPHLILECSDNIASNIDFNSMFNHLHHYLADTLPTQITSCKSRVNIYDHYFIGNDFEKNLFIHLTIKILPGRTAETKKKVCAYIHNYLNDLLERKAINNTSVSVELLELSSFYIK